MAKMGIYRCIWSNSATIIWVYIDVYSQFSFGYMDVYSK